MYIWSFLIYEHVHEHMQTVKYIVYMLITFKEGLL